MKSLEIVSHCHNSEEVPIYSNLLQLQLTSIYKYCPDDLVVTISIFYSLSDVRTVKVLDWFLARNIESPRVIFNQYALPKSELFRRACGRNIAALNTKADVIFFTDCDYIFLRGSLAAAHETCMNSDYNMVYPKQVEIHKTHDLGDQLIQKLDREPIDFAYIDPLDFMPKRQRKAIGGVQIVRGDYAREHGYLNNTKWTKPVDPFKGFLQCRCDVPFRKQVGQSEAVDIPAVYRVRHSRCGRDNGVKDHGEKTRK